MYDELTMAPGQRPPEVNWPIIIYIILVVAFILYAVVRGGN
jgi:hypothetical protein